MSQVHTTGDPFGSCAAVTTSDTTALSPPARCLYIGTGGDVVIVQPGSSTAVTFKNMPSGSYLWVQTLLVKTTNTTATNIVALW